MDTVIAAPASCEVRAVIRFLHAEGQNASKPWRLIYSAVRRMPSAVKVHTHLTGCLYPHLPRNLLPLNRFSRWMVIPWGSTVNVNFFGKMNSFSFGVLRASSKSMSMRKSTSSAKRDGCCVSVVIDKYSTHRSPTLYCLLPTRVSWSV